LERGFVTTNLQPSNLNGWDLSQRGAPGSLPPFYLDLDAQGTSEQKRRKRNKCLGSSKADPNFIHDDDLSMVGVFTMEEKTLVGKAYGRQFNEKNLQA
jgi:hypothetical protein